MPTSSSRIKGQATPEGTARYRDRHADVPKDHYRNFQNLLLSDLGIGTYLGMPDETTDQSYIGAITRALERGINVIDSSINYRFQRSERSIGAALEKLIGSKKVARDEIFVSTKGGFVSFDGFPTRDPMEYYKKVFFDRGIITPKDVVAGCHCMHPDYIRHELDVSRSNLGLETIDLYYLHNVETQFEEVSRPEFEKRLETIFAFLEGAVKEGKIGFYGLATWNMFRVPETEQGYFPLSRVLDIAQTVAGNNHHFRAVQLPFNLAYREAAVSANQLFGEEQVSFLRAAEEANLLVMASSPLFQGRLLGKFPAPLKSHFREAKNDAQCAIAFAAAAPGIYTALVGMSKSAHVDDNSEYLRQKRMDAAAWRTIIDNIE